MTEHDVEMKRILDLWDSLRARAECVRRYMHNRHSFVADNHTAPWHECEMKETLDMEGFSQMYPVCTSKKKLPERIR